MEQSSSVPSQKSVVKRPSTWRLVMASVTGTLIETYDVILTSLVAGLVFNHTFFPAIAPWIGTLAALAASAAVYVTRPLGAILFGWFGDRYGRLAALKLSIMGTGVATVGIGLVPSAQTVGVLAPILFVVLRLIQGVAFGGEFGGAVLVAMEHAPKKRRFFYGTFANAGSTGGVAVATIVVLTCTSIMGVDAFREWGWRVPFLASALLVLIAYIARRMEETDEFVQAKIAARDKVARPVGLSLFNKARLIVSGLVLVMPTLSITYGLSTGILSIASAGGLPGISLGTYQAALIVHTILVIPASLYGGWLGGKFKPETIVRAGAVFAIVTALPLVLCLNSGSVWLAYVGLILAVPGHGLLSGPATAYVAASLPVQFRYLGIGVAYAGGAILAGGLLPVVALSIIGSSYGTLLPFGFVILGSGVVGLLGTYFSKRAQLAAAREAGVAPAVGTRGDR